MLYIKLKTAVATPAAAAALAAQRVSRTHNTAAGTAAAGVDPLTNVKGQGAVTGGAERAAMTKAIAEEQPDNMKAQIAKHIPGASGRSWGAIGAVGGAAIGALNPGKDEDGDERGMIGGAMRGGVRGGLAGGMLGFGAKRMLVQPVIRANPGTANAAVAAHRQKQLDGTHAAEGAAVAGAAGRNDNPASGADPAPVAKDTPQPKEERLSLRDKATLLVGKAIDPGAVSYTHLTLPTNREV